MECSDFERLSSAAGTGEVLVVTYAGGRAPGHKRRIVVRAVDEETDEIDVLESGQIRTYFISRTRVVSEDDPAPWMPEGEGKAVAVDPARYFASWAFTIRPELHGALGVFAREVIDKDKTARARKDAIAKGLPKPEATRRIRILKREIVVNMPPVFDFHEGDIFYRGLHGGPDWAQVLAVKGEEVEVHLPGARDYRVSTDAFAHFLQTGVGFSRAFLIRDDSVVEEVGQQD